MTPKQYHLSTSTFSTDIKAPDFGFKDSTELYFRVIFVWDKTLFVRYFFELVQLVYHGSSHATLRMFTAYFTRYLQPFYLHAVH